MLEIKPILIRLTPDQWTMAGERITDVPRAIDTFPERKYPQVHGKGPVENEAENERSRLEISSKKK